MGGARGEGRGQLPHVMWTRMPKSISSVDNKNWEPLRAEIWSSEKVDMGGYDFTIRAQWTKVSPYVSLMSNWRKI